MPSMEQVAMMLLQNNPNVANTPMGQSLSHILQTGDVRAGEALAQDICRTMGKSPQQAMQDVQRSPLMNHFRGFFN